jgi:hypothetical protein
MTLSGMRRLGPGRYGCLGNFGTKKTAPTVGLKMNQYFFFKRKKINTGSDQAELACILFGRFTARRTLFLAECVSVSVDSLAALRSTRKSLTGAILGRCLLAGSFQDQ